MRRDLTAATLQATRGMLSLTTASSRALGADDGIPPVP